MHWPGLPSRVRCQPAGRVVSSQSASCQLLQGLPQLQRATPAEVTPGAPDNWGRRAEIDKTWHFCLTWDTNGGYLCSNSPSGGQGSWRPASRKNSFLSPILLCPLYPHRCWSLTPHIIFRSASGEPALQHSDQQTVSTQLMLAVVLCCWYYIKIRARVQDWAFHCWLIQLLLCKC